MIVPGLDDPVGVKLPELGLGASGTSVVDTGSRAHETDSSPSPLPSLEEFAERLVFEHPVIPAPDGLAPWVVIEETRIC